MCCGAIRSPCCPSAATIWATTSHIGWRWVGRIPHPPRLFQVNWFRKDGDGKYLWPGYGDNLRALLWMRERIIGTADATETPIGFVPTPDSLHRDGLDLSSDRLSALLSVDAEEWDAEIADLQAHFARFGDRLPSELAHELEALRGRWADIPRK